MGSVGEFLVSFSLNALYGAFSYVAIMLGILAVVVAVNEAYLRVAGGGRRQTRTTAGRHAQ